MAWSGTPHRSARISVCPGCGTPARWSDSLWSGNVTIASTRPPARGRSPRPARPPPRRRRGDQPPRADRPARHRPRRLPGRGSRRGRAGSPRGRRSARPRSAGPAPRRSSARRRVAASPTTNGRARAWSAGSDQARATTSGPIPATSPRVKATVGRSAKLGHGAAPAREGIQGQCISMLRAGAARSSGAGLPWGRTAADPLAGAGVKRVASTSGPQPAHAPSTVRQSAERRNRCMESPRVPTARIWN